MSKSEIRPAYLRVINGEGRQSPAWLNLRPTLLARSPFDRDQPVLYRLSKIDLQRLTGASRTQPIFDAWSVLIGEPPPINNISKWDDRLRVCHLSSMADAAACFRGIKRPVGIDDKGWDLLAYVSRPRWFFRYRPDHACVAELTEVPGDLVFVTYVRLDQPFSDHNPRIAPSTPSGVVTHWQFVEASAEDASLPVNHVVRYRKRLW